MIFMRLLLVRRRATMADDDMTSKRIDADELKAFMATVGPETKIYFGCDSERYRYKGKWYADYIKVIVIHIDGCKGCKIFAEVDTEEDYDNDSSRPFTRMMTEAMKITELHSRFKDLFFDFEISIHLDINPKKTAGSSVALEAARGYVRSLTSVEPEFKPNAWAGSYAADRAKEIGVVNPAGQGCVSKA